ncbi:MAG TPA: DUF4115 domain-containing protein [Acidimicrobiales bacterium]|nr:DUF4115 domain-containing protein [Acidimicrobiales bacterium]
MPPRRSRSNDLRAMEAYRRIHATIGERVVMPPDTPVRERPAPNRPNRPVRARKGRTGRTVSPPPGYLSVGTTRFRTRGPRPAGPVLTATAVIAVMALIALAVGRLVVGSPSTPRTSPPHRPQATATTRAAGRAAAGRAPVHTAGAAKRTRTSTPAPAVLVPRSSSATGADYVVTTASFSVQVSTTGTCWMEVGPSATGPFSFVGTVPAGQQKVFPASNQLWVRLGAPANVTVSVGGTPLQLSAAGSAPYNLTISAVVT